jgi:GTP cyclohydrolase IA
MSMDEDLTKNLLSHILNEGLDLNMSDSNLKDTPTRISKMYKELFRGLYEPPPKVTLFPNENKYDEIIMLDNIPFVSVCSHHFLPFQGLAWFAYIPEEHLCGASKIARLINHFAASPQLQENLTEEVMNAFVDNVKPKGALLVMRAVHGCMSCRGVKTGLGAGMITSKVYGSFKENPSTKNEVLQLIRMSIQLTR